jgi:hypothetical protein
MGNIIYVTVTSEDGFDEYWVSTDRFNQLTEQLLGISQES